MPELVDTNDTLRKLRDLIGNDLHSYEGPRSRLVMRIKEREQIYNSELPHRQYRGRANIRVPFPYTWVESMVPRYMASIFVGRDVLDVMPRKDTPLRNAQASKALLNYQLMYEAEFFWESYAFFKTLCRKGIAVCKVRWDDKKQCPTIIQICPEDFALDPRAAIVEKAAWVAHKSYMTKEELERGATAYATDPEGGLDPEAVNAVLQSKKPQTVFGEGLNTVTVPDERGLYEVWEWWGIGDLGRGPERLVALWCEKHLLNARPSPYKDLVPFIAMTDVPDPQRLSEGKSELDTITSLYEGASDMVNQRMDNVSQNINQRVTVLKGSGLDVNKLVSVPWGITEVDNHDDLHVHGTQNVTQDSFREVTNMLEYMKMATGLQDILRGTETNQIDTATGAQKLFEAANMRPGLKVKMMQFRYLKRMGEIFMLENQMFMSEVKQVLILGPDMSGLIPKVVHPSFVTGLFDIQPMGFDLAGNRDNRINQMVSLLNVLRGTPPNDPAWPLVQEIIQMAELKSGPAIIALAQQRVQAMQMAASQPPNPMAGQPGAPTGQPGVVNQPGVGPTGQQGAGGQPVGGQ